MIWAKKKSVCLAVFAANLRPRKTNIDGSHTQKFEILLKAQESKKFKPSYIRLKKA
jgi:hypothetical protein